MYLKEAHSYYQEIYLFKNQTKIFFEAPLGIARKFFINV